MRKWMVLMMAFLAAACSPLALFNRFTPKDAVGGEPLRAVPYGKAERQRLDLYPAVGDSPSPTVIFVYGGSWDSGRRQDYSWAGRALAAEGFLTIVPDYRLVPEVRFPTFIEDVAQSVAWAEANAAQHGGDPSRLFIVGHSAGAYIAAMVALDQRYLDQAGVRGRLTGVVGLSGPYDFFPFRYDAAIAAFGEAGDPQATQPINFARSEAPPFLLLHGGADRTVYVRNSQALARRLEAAGAEVRLQIYPDLSHTDIVLALSRPFRDKAPVLQDVAAFIREKAAAAP